MSNVTPFRRVAKSKAERKKPESYTFIRHPLALGTSEKDELGVLENYGDHVVVRAFTIPRQWANGIAAKTRKSRKYIVDTSVEGVRLLMRVHGLHHAQVSMRPNGTIECHLPPLTAGEA